MKKIALLVALFLTSFYGFSQTTKPIDGFLGIKFGSNKAAVLAAMKAKGIILDKEHSDNENLAFVNVKMGTKKVDGLLVRFINGVAFEADYIFLPKVEDKIIEDYKELIENVSQAYGEGQPTAKYKSPYQESDDEGDKITGLKLGDIDFYTTWVDSKNNSVQISITTDMNLVLKYQDALLVKQAVAKQNDKNKSDF